MHESFLEGLVAVFILDILADDADRDFVLGVIGAVDDVFPLGEVDVPGFKAKVLEGEGVAALLGEVEGDFVDGGHVAGDNDGFFFDVAESGDLRAHVAGDGTISAAEEDVGLDAD